jgi:hypothetical protein
VGRQLFKNRGELDGFLRILKMREAFKIGGKTRKTWRGKGHSNLRRDIQFLMKTC